jgi:uncharacterized protein (TIGR02421 family)
MISKRLQRLDKFIVYVSKLTDVSLINPKNARSAQTKFNKDFKVPVLTYTKTAVPLNLYKGLLQELHFGETTIEKLLEKKCKELILKIDLLLSIGTPQFAKYSAKLYPPPDTKLVSIAYEILKLKPSANSGYISRTISQSMVKKTFTALGFKWKIRTKDMVTSALASTGTKTLFLRKRERFSENYIKRLVVHEIGAHACRAENGALQKLELFKSGAAGYLETEEGIAVYSEYRSGLMTRSILRNYAGRVVAVNYALSHSFSATYKHLCRYFRPKTAFKLTLRAKRGVSNKNIKGAYTKDVVYLRGFLQVKQFVDRGGEFSDLFIGKIGISDLLTLKSVSDIVPVKFDPTAVKDLFDPVPEHITHEDIAKIIRLAENK